MIGNGPGHRGGAVHTGQNADVVPRRNLAIGAAYALKLGATPWCGWLDILAKGVISLEVAHHQIMSVDMLAGCYGL